MSRGKAPGGKGKYGYYKRISKSGKILQKKENLTEEEAQYNIEIAAEALKKYRAEQ